MRNARDDHDLAAKARELERHVPEGQRPAFRRALRQIVVRHGAAERAAAEALAAKVRLEEEADRLRERLAKLQDQSFKLQEIFRSNDQAFANFRKALAVTRRLRSLAELPDILTGLRQALRVNALSCLLAAEDFAGLAPPAVPCRPRADLADALAALSGDRHGQRPFVGPVRTIPRLELFLPDGPHATDQRLHAGSCFIAPLRDKYRPERLMGTLAFLDTDPERYTPAKGTDFLEHFCESLGSDVMHVAIHEELERQREVDELTGIPNRVHLSRHAPRLLKLAERKAAPVALLFVDLDNFKAVNDTLGHEAGDTVLRAVAQAIKGHIRAYDLFARLGGDEFVLLLPETDAAEATATAERLRVIVAEAFREVCSQAGGNISLSASVGLAMLGPGQSVDELVRQADTAMYADKRTCRRPRPAGAKAK